jgi:hypothetical protein
VLALFIWASVDSKRTGIGESRFELSDALRVMDPWSTPGLGVLMGGYIQSSVY